MQVGQLLSESSDETAPAVSIAALAPKMPLASLEPGRPEDRDLGDVLDVTRRKSGSYTVRRPLELGAETGATIRIEQRPDRADIRPAGRGPDHRARARQAARRAEAVMIGAET